MGALSERVGTSPMITPDLRVWVSSDFGDLLELCHAAGRHTPAPAFHPDFATLSADQAFCVLATDSSGELVHTQAVRVIDQGGESIGSYFKRNSGLFMPVDPRIDSAKTEIRPSPGWYLAGDSFTYHGEVWIRPDMRKRGLCPALIKFAIAKTIEAFNPDNLFTITVPAVMNRKFVEAIGYPGFTPSCIVWRSRDGTAVDEEGIGWIPNAGRSTPAIEPEREFRSVA